MSTQHKNIVEADLHEPKGASTAAAGEVFIADGLGSGSFIKEETSGSWFYSNIGTGTTYTTPTSYTLINMAGTAKAADEWVYNSLGRLTYSGAANRHAHITISISFKHSTGTGTDCYFAIFLNGVEETGSNIVQDGTTGYSNITLHWDMNVVSTDYVEIFLKTSSGNIIIHQMYAAVGATV